MKAKSIKGRSTEEISTALNESMADDFKPTLAIVFISVKQGRNAVCKLLDDAGIAIFGATTNGEFIDEELEQGSIAILLLDINPSYFAVFFEEFPDKNYREISQGIAKKAKEIFSNPSFLIAGSNLETDAEELLFGVEDVIGKQVNVFGGMAGDDYSFIEQFVFTNNKAGSRATLVLAFDEDKVTMKGKATCGWRAIGTERTVTKSEGNHVYSVDDISVLDLTIKYGGIENVKQGDTAVAMDIAVNFPLQLQREVGDPVMRPGLLIKWDDGSFYCSGSVPQGSKVRFSLPPDFDVMEQVVKGVE
ncbi:MAG: hypothetical protein EOO14_00500, partial [Chitinophagaceae bacterium]